MKAQRYLILVAFSFLVSLIFGLPNILIPSFLGNKDYAPVLIGDQVPFYTMDETLGYVVRTQEALKNGFFLSDPALYEYRNIPSFYISESISAKSMAILAKIFGSVSNAFLVSDFLLPVISFLLIYYLVFLLTSNFTISLFSSFTVLTGSHLLKYIQFPYSDILMMIDQMRNGFLISFTRSFHPQMSIIYFLLAVVSLYLLLIRKGKTFVLMSGVFFGLVFYSYIYYIAYFIVGFFVLLLLYLIGKNFDIVKRLLVSFLISLVFAVPFFHSFLSFIFSPFYTNLKTNQATPLEDTFWLSVKILLTSILVFLFLRKKKAAFYFLEAFLISGLILSNLQFVLKNNMQLAGHISMRAVYPWITICIFAVLGNFKFRTKLLKSFLSVFLILIFVILTVYSLAVHYSFSKNNFSSYHIDSSESDMYSWLNKNTQEDSVVATASLRMSASLLAFTHNRVFIPHSFLTVAPSEEILERIFIMGKMLGISDETIRGQFEKTLEKEINIKRKRWEYDKCGNWFVFFLRYSDSNYRCYVPEEVVNKIVSDYKNYRLTSKNVRKYRIDYLLIGPYERAVGRVSQEINLSKKVYENEKYSLYEFRYDFANF